MYRAEIDIKRIRTLMKLDENLEERKKLEFGIQNRFGSALLMMNETVARTAERDLRPPERRLMTADIERKLKDELNPKLAPKVEPVEVVKVEPESEVKTEIEVV